MKIKIRVQGIQEGGAVIYLEGLSPRGKQELEVEEPSQSLKASPKSAQSQIGLKRSIATLIAGKMLKKWFCKRR